MRKRSVLFNRCWKRARNDIVLLCHKTQSPRPQLATALAAALVGVFCERVRVRRSLRITRAPGFKAWRMSKWIKHNGRVETQGLVGTDNNGTVGEQTAQALERLGAILDEAGSSKNQLLSVTIYLKDLDRDFEGMNAVYDAWLGDEKPTRACVQTKLGHGWLVEIRANAAA